MIKVFRIWRGQLILTYFIIIVLVLYISYLIFYLIDLWVIYSIFSNEYSDIKFPCSFNTTLNGKLCLIIIQILSKTKLFFSCPLIHKGNCNWIFLIWQGTKILITILVLVYFLFFRIPFNFENLTSNEDRWKWFTKYYII